MKKKLEKLAYMVLGALIALFGYFLGTASNEIEAQLEPSVLDKVVCRNLEIVDSQGKSIASFGRKKRKEGISILRIYDAEGRTVIDLLNDDAGGVVAIGDKDGKIRALMFNNDAGGVIAVRNKNDDLAASMLNDDAGGVVLVRGKNGEADAAMLNNDAGGVVVARDTFGNITGTLP